MSDGAQKYNTGVIRELLLAAFGPAELRRFCQDHLEFRPVLDDVAPNASLNELSDHVLSFCDTRFLTPQLLAEVERLNPKQYGRFKDRLLLPAAALASIPCPYRGLEVFHIQHAPDYFGREAMICRLMDRLAATNFVAVVGPSGCGKSSLVRAGMVPALRRGALRGSESWRVELFLPGADPLRSLALTLVYLLMPDATPVDHLAEARKLADHLHGGTVPLADILALIKGRYSTLPRLVLVADQFEEAFTLCGDESLRRLFLETLLHVAETSWVTVVLTLRADFFGRVLEDEPFGRRVDEGQVNVLPMTRDERREAVERPASRAGRRFEEGLVERILDAVEGSPGDLPLLEFALTELWGRQTAGGLLTHDAYEAGGEVRGAIAHRADATYSQLTPDEQRAVRAVFTRLVRVSRPDEGSEDTRRRIALDELVPEARPLVKTLADARLLVTSRDPASREETVEVAHEALIRGWQTLQDWLNGDREFLLWRQRLDTLAGIWHDTGRGEGALLRGTLLQEARVRSAGREDDLGEAERAFLEASEGAARAAEAAQQAARQRELEQARALAEEQQRRAEERAHAAHRLRQRNRFLLVALAAAILAATGVVLFFFREREARSGLTIEVSLRATAQAISVTRQVEAQTEANARATEIVVRTTAEALAVQRQAEAQTAVTAEASQRQIADQKAAEAKQQTERAEYQARRAKSGELAAGAQLELASPSYDPSLALLLAMQAVTMTWNADGYVAPAADTALRDAVNRSEALGWRMTLPHGPAVLSAAFSPDCKWIVTSGENGTARMWDSATGAELRWLGGHTYSVKSVAFSPDGKWIVTAGEDGTVRVWDTATGAELHRLEGHAGSVYSAAFSPDGKWIVTASWDGTARMWDAAIGVEVRRFIGHEGIVFSATFSPDGKRIVTAGYDGTARVWDAATGTELHRLEGHTYSVLSAAFSSDGKWIVTASYDGTVRLWDVASGAELRQVVSHTKSVNSAAFSPDGKWIATAGEDGTARVWDVATGAELRRLEGHTNSVNSAAFSPDGKWIITGGEDGTARVWDAITGTELRRLEGHTGSVYSAAFCLDGKWIVTAGEDGTAWVWDVATGAELRQLVGHTNSVNSVAFSPDGKWIVTAGYDGTARIWDAASGAELRQLVGHTNSVNSVAFSPDGKWIVTAGYDGTARIWDTATGTELHRLEGHADHVNSAAFSPDGKWIVTASWDGTARVWDAASGAELRQLVGHTNSVKSAAFSPDGKWIVTAMWEGTARIWDAASGAELRQLVGHTNSVNSAAFSPDGKWIVTAGEDGTARVWDAVTGAELRWLEGHTGSVYSAAFSSDGKWIVTGSKDGTVRMWLASMDDLLAQARSLIQRVPPAFTDDERQRYGLDDE